MSKEYIKLPRMNNQVVRQRYYISEAMEHPAKAHIPMMIWVLKEFVEDGDIVLDPLAGIGTTMVEGMRVFPNSLFIGIELEEKFTKWAQASIKKVEEIAKRDWFMKIGKAICVQGDAKELEKVLKEKVDKIITSPPYSGVMDPKRHTDSGICGRDPKMTKMRYVDKIITSPPYSETLDPSRKSRTGPGGTSQPGAYKRKEETSSCLPHYGDNPDNIGSLKHGSIDKIITSPPFGQAQSGGGIAKKGYKGEKHSPHNIGKRSYMPKNIGGKENISNLPYVDKIISSPPFGGKVQHKTNYLGKKKGESGFEYSDNPENIGNLPQGKIDKIISSPPYSDVIKEVKAGHQDLESQHEAVKARARAIAREAEKTHPGTNYHTPGRLKAIETMISGYSINKENIGNTKGKTYLEAMLLVYYQCYKVLKPNGLMVLITKDFIRDFKRVHLGEDTLKLCKMAGFKHIATYHRKIRHPSFWRIHYYQKHPEVERIECEDIFCFRKE